MTEEEKPYPISSELNVFFDPDGVIMMGGGLHMKIILPGTPTLETLDALVERIDKWRERRAKTRPVQKATEIPQQQAEFPPAEQPAQEGNRPPGGATAAQCKAILAICHRTDMDVTEKEMTKYHGAEWRVSKDGNLLPEWDFLQSLTKQQASNIIERLGRAAS